MARTGRPPKVINWTEFEKLCRIQCSLLEMCEWFGVSDKTLYRGCKEHYGETFSVVFAKKRIGGLISLRHNNFKLSEKNAAMAIFLSKNLLGMTDTQKIEYTDKKAVSELTDEELTAIVEGRRSSRGVADPTEGA